MNKHIITIAILTAFAAAPAWAGNPGNNGEGNGGCGVGQQTNGCGGGTPSGGQGGAGGNGGAGGHGGAGGSVLGSGNSSNLNSNANTNLLGQMQGQAQGQIATSNSGGNTLSNGSSSSSGATSSSGGNTMVGGAVSTSTSVNVGGDTVTYEAQARNPVASAWAAPLAASNGTCMGSTSAGAQGVTIGLSVGTTWTDKSCDARYDAISLNSLGQGRAAVARLCQKAEIADAMQAAGTPCPSTVEKKAAAVTTGATVSSTHSDVFVN